MSEHHYDIVIIGAGPAGSSAALSIRKHAPQLRCLLIESSDFKENRIGESLSPMANQVLDGLQLSLNELMQGHEKAPLSMGSWGQATLEHNDYLFHTHGHGWRLNRKKFDASLAHKAKKQGAELWLQTNYLQSTSADNNWNLILRKQNKEMSISAQYVIDASGRNAKFAKRQAPEKQRYDRMIALYAWHENIQHPPKVLPATVEAQKDGWWYSASIPGNKIVSVWMTDSDLYDTQLLAEQNYQQKLAKSTHTQAQLKDHKLLNMKLYPAGSQKLKRPGGPGWLAAGDACCTFDPLSSSGILKALQSGVLASYVAMDHCKGIDSLAKYEQYMKGVYDQYLVAKKQYYQQEQRWKNHPFWKRRHQ